MAGGWLSADERSNFVTTRISVVTHKVVLYTYVRAISGGEAWFWSYTDGFWATPEFDHFDVKGWSFSEQDSQGNYIDISTHEHIVHGDRTPDSAMPTSGTATYDGRMEARSFPSDDAVFTGSSLHSGYRGDVTLTADFANAGVAGEITSLESRIGNYGSYSLRQPAAPLSMRTSTAMA